jgi:hypothetical protein
MSDHALRNLNAMCEVELILVLHDIVPLLECVHMFIKITQGKNIFVCDYVENIKLAQHEFYMLYCDPHTIFDDPTFDNFNAIKNIINNTFPMSWFFLISMVEKMLCIWHPHLLNISTMYINMTYLVLENFSLS